jgi:hypothetical protein
VDVCPYDGVKPTNNSAERGCSGPRKRVATAQLCTQSEDNSHFVERVRPRSITLFKNDVLITCPGASCDDAQ